MRQYDILYRSISGMYLIIAKDEGESFWFVYQDAIEDSATAKEICNALNAAVNK